MTDADGAGPPGSASSRGATGSTFGLFRRLLQRPELDSLGGLAAAFAVFSILRPDLFLTHDNGVNVVSLAAQYGIVAVGVTLLMIAGHFDLSVGTIVGLTGWAMFYFGNVLGLPPILTIVCALAVGTLLGALNGVIQVRTGLPSFIITLATSLLPLSARSRSAPSTEGMRQEETLRRSVRQTASLVTRVSGRFDSARAEAWLQRRLRGWIT